jgi:hypothetical protein
VPHVARPALQANGLEQPAQIGGGARVEIEIVGRGFAGCREPDFQLLELSGENRAARRMMLRSAALVLSAPRGFA